MSAVRGTHPPATATRSNHDGRKTRRDPGDRLPRVVCIVPSNLALRMSRRGTAPAYRTRPNRASRMGSGTALARAGPGGRATGRAIVLSHTAATRVPRSLGGRAPPVHDQAGPGHRPRGYGPPRGHILGATGAPRAQRPGAPVVARVPARTEKVMDLPGTRAYSALMTRDLADVLTDREHGFETDYFN